MPSTIDFFRKDIAVLGVFGLIGHLFPIRNTNDFGANFFLFRRRIFFLFFHIVYFTSLYKIGDLFIVKNIMGINRKLFQGADLKYRLMVFLIPRFGLMEL